jgi:hypothetical protein
VILSKPPGWAISSRQAAEIPGCKQSSPEDFFSYAQRHGWVDKSE